MAGNTLDQAALAISGSPATAMLGANTRVKGQPGFMGTQTDALLFSGPGQWIAVNTRTRIQGVFMVSQSSQGTSLPPGSTSPIPILVPAGDARVRSM